MFEKVTMQEKLAPSFQLGISEDFYKSFYLH